MGVVRSFDDFMTVSMKNVVFWDATLCGFYKKRIASIIRVERINGLGTKLIVTSN
jgi:hypothetical protein